MCRTRSTSCSCTTGVTLSVTRSSTAWTRALHDLEEFPRRRRKTFVVGKSFSIMARPGAAARSLEVEARANAVGDVRLAETRRDRVAGAPSGAVSRDDDAGVELGQVIEHPRDQRLDHRPVRE